MEGERPLFQYYEVIEDFIAEREAFRTKPLIE